MSSSAAIKNRPPGVSKRLVVDWCREVPIKPLQQRFKELRGRGVSAKDIARNLGWLLSEGHSRAGEPDSTRVFRALGLAPYHHGGETHWKRTIKPETAKKLAEAMWSDPVDLGF